MIRPLVKHFILVFPLDNAKYAFTIMKGEMNNDIIYNFTNSIIADRFSGDRDYCRRSDTATDIR